MNDLPLFAPRPQSTSRDALKMIGDTGLLVGARLAVFKALVELGPSTGAEVDAHLAREGGRGHMHKRLPELRQLGCVVEGDVRECRVTGHRATTWAISGALPQKRQERAVPKSTRIKDLEVEVEALRTRVVELERERDALRTASLLGEVDP